MRLFADIAYRGACYHGWQIQPGDLSVQEVLETALSRLCGIHTPVTGAGRTDAGVNASRMIAHFDVPDRLCPDGETSRLCKALDSMCGKNIAVYSLTPVVGEAHARFDAIARVYRYFVTDIKDPFTHPLAWRMPRRLDFNAMNRAAEALLGIHDFTSFSKLHSSAKTNICDLRYARWLKVKGFPGLWCFEIEADRFLRNMVRAVTGTLVEVGRNAKPQSWVKEVLEAKDRGCAGVSMPGEPLFLHDIKYPSEVYTPPGRAYGLNLTEL